MEEVREWVEQFIGSCEYVIREYDGGKGYKKGIEVGNFWLRLIDSPNLTRAELLSFIKIVHANRYRSSAWFDFALRAYEWVDTKGVMLPSWYEFFACEIPKDQEFLSKPPLEQARLLIEYFGRNNDEDPNNEVWMIGASTARSWLKLIETQGVTEREVSTFINGIPEKSHKLQSSLWDWMLLCVFKWCAVHGYSNLIWEEYRSMVRTTDSSR